MLVRHGSCRLVDLWIFECGQTAERGKLEAMRELERDVVRAAGFRTVCEALELHGHVPMPFFRQYRPLVNDDRPQADCPCSSRSLSVHGDQNVRASLHSSNDAPDTYVQGGLRARRRSVDMAEFIDQIREAQSRGEKERAIRLCTQVHHGAADLKTWRLSRDARWTRE